MKFLVVTFLALATGAFALPGGGPPPPPPPPAKPTKPAKPPTNKQQISCGNGQSLYCCTNEGGNDVTCASFSNGGIGGVCNGMQVCCNNNVSDTNNLSTFILQFTDNRYSREPRAATSATAVAPSPSPRTSPVVAGASKSLTPSATVDHINLFTGINIMDRHLLTKTLRSLRHYTIIL